MFCLYFFLYGNQYVPLRNVPPSRKQMILREQFYTASVPMEHTELTPVKREAERVNKKGEMSGSSPPPAETDTSPVLQAVSSICHRHLRHIFYEVTDREAWKERGEERRGEREGGGLEHKS